MPKRPISSMPAAEDAAKVLGQQIRTARHHRGWTAANLAARVGVTPRTILAVEAGAPGTAIGTVLNAATLCGVPLFGLTDPVELARLRLRGEEYLALLPTRVYQPPTDGEPEDDF